MLEASTYSAQLIQTKTESGQSLWAQFGYSSKNRTPQVVLTFSIVGGNNDGAVVQFTGFMTDKAIDRTMEYLATVGFVGDDLDGFNDQTPHGRVEIVTEVEEYKGSKRARVKFINSGAFTIASGDRMGTKDLKSFSERIRAEKARRAASAGFDPDAPPADDDVRW